MRKKLFAIIMSLVLASQALTGCGSKKDDPKPATTDISSSTEDVKESVDKEDASDTDDQTEEDSQIGKGVNGEIPNPVYSYEGIVNGAVGLCPTPHHKKGYSVSQWTSIRNEWTQTMRNEVDKIEEPLSANATDEEINRFFNQLLYIMASDYSAIEEISRFSYVLFKKDKEDPFTKESIAENKQINVEIVLDASGSMAKQINGQTMMTIAKNSITEVLKQLPENAKVGLRVFGHLGNNTNSGKKESCAANELIYPIETLNAEGIAKALSSVEPRGWTSIANSIKNGVEDLSKLKSEDSVNILYIITDGIETCGGNPVQAAQALKNEGTDIILGIIGFNVNATQDAALKKIAQAGQGYYANANDAATLTAELYNISEAANTLYNWEPLTETLFLVVSRNHNLGLFYNKYAISGTYIFEHSALNEAIEYAQRKGLLSDNKDIAKKLKEKNKNRQETVKKILEEEYKKRESESSDYLASLKSRKGEEVAFIKTTSRVNPFSDYYISTSGVGGSIEDSKEDGENMNTEQEEKMKNN